MASLEDKGHDRGYMAFIVALGCGVTILGYTIVVWSFWLGVILLSCFVASGAFMIIGSVRRYVRKRAEDESVEAAEVKESFGE